MSYRRRELLNTAGVKQISSITAEFASQEERLTYARDESSRPWGFRCESGPGEGPAEVINEQQMIQPNPRAQSFLIL